MTVRLLQPDTPQPDMPPSSRDADANAFLHAVDALGAIFDDAKAAEDSYGSGAGSLRDAVYERARADVALAVAVAGAQRTAQALQSIFNMQV